MTELYESVRTDNGNENFGESDFELVENGLNQAEDLLSNHLTNTDQGNERDLNTDDYYLNQHKEFCRRLIYFGKQGTKWRKLVSFCTIRSR